MVKSSLQIRVTRISLEHGRLHELSSRRKNIYFLAVSFAPEIEESVGGGGGVSNYGNVVDLVVLKAVCCSSGFIIFVKV